MPTHHMETLLQEDVRWGTDLDTKRNPNGGTLSGTQVGVHSMAVGQAAVQIAWSPDPVASLGTEETEVAVPGAAVGDFVLVAYSRTLEGLIILPPEVTAANIVTVTLFNPTAARITPGSGTLKVLVLKSR